MALSVRRLSPMIRWVMAADFRDAFDQGCRPGRMDVASLHEARISCGNDVNAMVPDLTAAVWVEGCSVEGS